MTGTPNLSHLHESRRELALCDSTTRKAAILSDRWVGYSKAREALSKMDALLAPTQISRKKSLLILADSDNGKTTLLRRFQSLNKGETLDDELIHTPILCTDMPSAPDIGRLYTYLLQAAFVAHNPNASKDIKEAELSRVIATLGVRVLMIDEFSNVLQAGPRTLDAVLAALRVLSNRHGLSIIAAGVRSASAAVIGNSHLFTRFDVFELPLWKPDTEFRRMLMSMETLLPLRRPSRLRGQVFSDLMFPACRGLIGSVSDFLNHAALAAIESGEERISPDILKAVIASKASVKQAIAL